MIRIARLSMRLPGGLTGRADGIARQVGEALAQRGTPTRGLERRTLGGIRAAVTTGQSDAEIGAAIGAAIWSRVRSESER